MTSHSNLKDLEQLVASFILERDWRKYHTPKNLAMSIAIEAAEIMELFQWYTNEEAIAKISSEEQLRAKLADELADVMIYCLSLGYHSSINLEKAIKDKLTRNKIRFPVEKVSGKLGPY